MHTNIEIISQVIDYIDDNLDGDLRLDTIAEIFGYSKYHLHRMFSFITGMPLNSYIKRRKLTEAARALVKTEKSIIDIALDAGYESQQAFTNSFKKIHKKSPDKYRKKNNFMPIQLKYQVDENAELNGDRVMDVKEVDGEEIIIIGYMANTAKGFWVIGPCHGKLNKVLDDIKNRVDSNCIIGLNDYTSFSLEDEQLAYNYYAAVEVSSTVSLPDGITSKIMPPSKYVVFSFFGNKKASTKNISMYIYEKWFPQSTYRFNEDAMYDFLKYGEEINEKGQSKIEYWVPVT